jgi:hypothetical protein
VTDEGEEAEATETAQIYEVMRQSGLVVTEGAIDEDAHTAEAEEVDIEEENADEEQDYNTLIPTKPSHLDFEKSTISEAGRQRRSFFILPAKKPPQNRKMMK